MIKINVFAKYLVWYLANFLRFSIQLDFALLIILTEKDVIDIAAANSKY